MLLKASFYLCIFSSCQPVVVWPRKWRIVPLCSLIDKRLWETKLKGTVYKIIFKRIRSSLTLHIRLLEILPSDVIFQRIMLEVGVRC